MVWSQGNFNHDMYCLLCGCHILKNIYWMNNNIMNYNYVFISSKVPTSSQVSLFSAQWTSFKTDLLFALWIRDAIRKYMNYKWGICCFQNPKRSTRCCASFLVERGARCNNLCFSLEKISQYTPHSCTPRNFTEVEGPWNFVGYISPLWNTCLTLLTRSNLHSIINLMDKCDIMWEEKAIKIPTN